MKKNPPNTISINNNIKITHSLSEWLIEILLIVLYLLLIIMSPLLFMRTPTQTGKYLRKLYQRNWNNYLITNIYNFNSQNCTSNQTAITLGIWSGYKKDSCYCEFNSAIFFSEKKNICNKKTFNKMYSCHKINEIDSKPILTYKNKYICVIRSQRSIASFHQLFREKYNGKKNDYKEYYNTILNEESKINLNNFVSEINYDSENDIFVPSILTNESLSLFEFNELLSDIHLENELQCAYNDLSNINPINQNEGLNLYNILYNGSHYCNHFDSNLHYYYDNGIRSKVLLDNIQYSDLNSEISDYYNNLGLTNLNFNNPKIIGEKILYGIGCPFMKSPENHYKKYKYFNHLRRFSLVLSIFSLAIFVIGIIFLIFRLCNNCVDSSIIYFFFSCFLFICLIVSMTMSGLYLGFSLNTYLYLNKFNKYCQTNYSTSNNGNNIEKKNMALPLEIGLLNDLYNVIMLCVFTIILELLIFIFLIIYYCNNCYEHKLVFITPEMYEEQTREFKIHARNLNVDREEENKITDKAETVNEEEED